MGASTERSRNRTIAPGMVILVFLLLISTLHPQAPQGLLPLKPKGIETYYSEGAGIPAREMAERSDRVLSYYRELLCFAPWVRLLVLSREDWTDPTDVPVYGMPHYDDDKALIVASQDNEFWRGFIPTMEDLPQELALKVHNAYPDPSAKLSMRPFFDLLAIHELGHAFHL